MVSRIMAKKGALCSLLFESRRTFSASTDISSFCIKGLIYFGEPLGSCRTLSKTVSYLARTCAVERKLPLLSFERSSLDPRKGKLHFANINVTFTSLSKTFFQKSVFFQQRLVQRFFYCPPVSPLLIYDTRLLMMCVAFMASNSL